MSWVAPSSSALSPSASRLSGLRAQVMQYVQMPDDDDAHRTALQGLNNGIARLNARSWGWDVTWQDISLNEGISEYPLRSDYKSGHSSELLNSAGQGYKHGLAYYDDKTFLMLFPDRTTNGSPRGFTVHNPTTWPYLALSCPPDLAFVGDTPYLRMRYHRRLPLLTQDEQTIGAPQEVELFVVWYAREVMSAIYQPQLYALARDERTRIWRDLERADTEQQFQDWS